MAGQHAPPNSTGPDFPEAARRSKSTRIPFPIEGVGAKPNEAKRGAAIQIVSGAAAAFGLFERKGFPWVRKCVKVAASPMSLSRKGYKTINHRDVQYRWLLRCRGGVNEASIYTQAAVGGRELIAELPRVINVSLVTDAIDFACANNWNPNEAGKTMRCQSKRGAFVLVD